MNISTAQCQGTDIDAPTRSTVHYPKYKYNCVNKSFQVGVNKKPKKLKYQLMDFKIFPQEVLM